MLMEVGPVTITTAADGSATVYIGQVLRGKVVAIKYDPGTIDGGAGLVITAETTGFPILTKAAIGTSVVLFYPLAPANKVADGAASTLTEVPVIVFRERIKLVMAAGGNTLTGRIWVYIEHDE